jgi:amino acid adenylation domain-containing protein/non-ribosomal peptide synthase protein (TIGR01720 family)
VNGGRDHPAARPPATAAERIASLSAAKRAVLERRLRAARSTAGPPPPQPRSPGLATFPLSFAQERLWALEHVAPGRSVYNLTGALRLTGPLDVAALLWSLGRLAIRHEMLRTVVPAADARAVQVICSPARVVPAREDLRGLPAAERERELAARMAAQMRRPFNLALGPLWRATLFRLAPEAHVLAVTLHHIVADAWAVRVLVEELLDLYAARTGGTEPALPELAFQYADYAVWQRALLDRGAFDGALADWTRELGGRAAWESPLDRPRPAVPSFRGAVEARTLPRPLGARVERLCAATGTTPFMVGCGVLAVVLAEWSGRPDVCVLSPTANREGHGLERCVGFFVNVVALGIDVDVDRPFTELVRHVRRRALRAYASQHVPFELVVAAVESERRIDRAPLSTVAFAVEAERSMTWTAGPLAVALEEIQRRTVETDLLLTVRYGGADLTARLEYAQELFEPATVRRLLARYEGVLGWVLDHPDRPLRERGAWAPGVDDLSPAPRAPRGDPASGAEAATALRDEATPLVGIEPHPGSGAEAATALQAFAAQVAAGPARTAVADSGGGYLTYADLDREASAIAAALRQRGAGRDAIVGVVGRRTPAFAAALLGVLKAGSAFVPIDPRLPAGYLRQIVAESAPRCLVAEEASLPLARELAAAGGACEVLPIAGGRRGERAGPAAPETSPAARDLAYVIFTSGSSGTPKGAMIEHRGMLNHLRAKIALLGLTATDRVAHTAPSSFDVAVWQWLAPLLAGATVEIVDDADARSPEQLLDQLERRGVSIVELVPSLLRAVLDKLDGGAPSRPRLTALRTLIVTGEPLAPGLCRRWLAHYPGVPIVNAYGPTECSDDVTHFEVAAPPPPDQLRVPIGWPIDGVRLYVDDGGLVPLRPGLCGELCVGGAAVGRGYVGDAERTAAAFVSDPWSDDPAARLYRTGDVVRVLDDGSLDLLGRRDRQVKIAGCRIEVEEIEARLRGHDGVRDVAVVARAGADGRLRLTAYVVPATPEPSVRAWRRFLAERVPPQMVPSRFVTLEALPLTAHLKVDREALPDPAARSGDDGPQAAPATGEAEERLRAIWKDLLGVQEIGPDDDFFQLGGDSILSIQVSARARRAGLYLTARDVFEHPTIARLAARARSRPGRPAEQGLVSGPVPLAPSQAAFLAGEPAAPERHTLAIGLAVAEPLDATLLTAALERLTLHHDALRLRFTRTAGGWTQDCALPDGGVPVRLIEIGDARAGSWPGTLRRVEGELRGVLDLRRGPLAAVALVRRAPRARARLVVVVHHLVCDTVSAHVLLEDLETAYRQLAAGLDVSLPPKTTSFRAWSEYLADYAGSEACRAQVPFWMRQLGEDGEHPRRDGGAGACDGATVRTLAAALDAGATARLCRGRHGAPARALLLGALLHAIEPALERPSVVVELESHAREELHPAFDLARSVGWLACGYPLGFPRSAMRSLAGAVGLAGERLAAVPANGVGYGALRHLDRGQEAAPLRAAPPPEWKLNYLGAVGGGAVGRRLFTPIRIPPPPGGFASPAPAPALELTVFVTSGRLHVEAAYREPGHRRAAVERVVSRMLAGLTALAAERVACA